MIGDMNFFKFQSPQWGSNSKDGLYFYGLRFNLKVKFQSPQWGSNSKAVKVRNSLDWNWSVSVPSMGK